MASDGRWGLDEVSVGVGLAGGLWGLGKNLALGTCNPCQNLYYY